MNLYDKLSDPIAMLVFILTLILPVLIGFLSMKKTKNQTDYFVGGRGINKYVVALSAVSSGRSSWLVLGLSGIAYIKGVAAVWAVVGYIIIEMFQFIYIGRKLRSESGKFGSITILDYFESKFGDKSNLLRITGAIIIIFFMTTYVSAQFNAGAKALSTAMNISLFTALIIATLLVLIYMVLGGFIAVAYNDVVRAIIMIVGLVIFPIYGLYEIGGFKELIKALNPSLIDPFSLGIGAMAGYLGIGLGSPGQPHIVVRYMSISNPEELRFASVIGTIWNVIMAWGAIFIGLLGRALIKLETLQTLPATKPQELVYLVLASKYFGPILYGIIIGGIFAAILSTADSQLLVIASTFVRDIYEKILNKNKNIPEKKKMIISRTVVILSGLTAMILAYYAKESIFWLVLNAWGGLGAAFGTTIIFTLYWKRTTKYGVFAGFITGALVNILWWNFLKNSTGIYELIPAFISASLMIVVISLLTKNYNK